MNWLQKLAQNSRHPFPNDFSHKEINRNVKQYWDTGGISSHQTKFNFWPAFLNKQTKEIHWDKKFGIHNLAVIPQKYWVATDPEPNPSGYGPEPIAVVKIFEDGFIDLDSGKFYTREEAAKINEKT